MNTLELLGLLEKTAHKRTHVLGVLACNELPKRVVKKLPMVTIVNTDPSSLPGTHWLAIYITEHRHGYFFDSFGHSAMYNDFPKTIYDFMIKNCAKISHSSVCVQDHGATTCGEHAVFFLYHIQKHRSYQRVLNMYSKDPICNDLMVCSFVKGIQPGLCRGHVTTCIQCAKH